jgi:hypothetical protein
MRECCVHNSGPTTWSRSMDKEESIQMRENLVFELEVVLTVGAEVGEVTDIPSSLCIHSSKVDSELTLVRDHS